LAVRTITGHVGPRSRSFEHLLARQLRQHQVEDDEVDLLLGQASANPVEPVGGDL
jgi:hypothetical protein